MRTVAWIMVALVLCVGAALAYSLYAAELGAVVIGVEVTPASDRAEEFSALRQAVEERSLIGVLFLAEPLGEPGEYEFHTYTVRGKNNGFLPADWIRMDVRPEAGDVLQIDKESANQLPAMSEGVMELTVLAKRGSGAERELSMTYFIWSRLYRVSVRQR